MIRAEPIVRLRRRGSAPQKLARGRQAQETKGRVRTSDTQAMGKSTSPATDVLSLSARRPPDPQWFAKQAMRSHTATGGTTTLQRNDTKHSLGLLRSCMMRYLFLDEDPISSSAFLFFSFASAVILRFAIFSFQTLSVLNVRAQIDE